MTLGEQGTANPSESWLSPAQVGSLAGVSARTVTAACRSGALPHRRTPHAGGFRYEIAAPDAETWASARLPGVAATDHTPLVFELALERGRVQELERQLAEERLAAAETRHQLELRLRTMELEAGAARDESRRLRAALAAMVDSAHSPTVAT